MSRHALILSSTSDVHAAAAAWGLRLSGSEVIWSKSASLADEAVGSLSVHADGEASWELGGALGSGSASAVWFRRARDPRAFPKAPPCDAAFLRDEWMLFQRNLYAMSRELSDALWINHPASAELAENKLVQLQAARRCGLRFPDTLVSNDPREIARFRKRHARVIYKPFAPHTWLDVDSQRGFIAHARLLEPDVCIDDESLMLCPGIYQAYVDKVCDLRVTVIGDRYFPIRLGSSLGGAYVDWRSHTRAEDFHAETCSLPATYQDKLQALMEGLSIVFGCIDLVLDKAGELHFLEVNQAGQFLFVERWLKSVPLLRAMCAMLAEGRTNYSLDSVADVSYRTFRESDAYLVWSEEANAAQPSPEDMSAFLTLE